jgi:hypothetical protein
MLGLQRHSISWYTCMYIYVHKSLVVTTTLLRPWGPLWGGNSVCNQRCCVTYKAVDILKIENYKLYYFGITFFALITPPARSKPTLGALHYSLPVQFITVSRLSIFLSVHPPSVAVRLFSNTTRVYLCIITVRSTID